MTYLSFFALLSAALAQVDQDAVGPVEQASAEKVLADLSGENENQKILAKVYMTGLTHGANWANVVSEDSNGKKIFCLPDDQELPLEDYIDIIRKTVIKDPENAKYPVGLVLIVGLEETFPCQ